jgi:hypothetical protein
MYFSNSFINCLLQLKGIEGFKECFKSFLSLPWNVFGFEDSLVGSLR